MVGYKSKLLHNALLGLVFLFALATAELAQLHLVDAAQASCTLEKIQRIIGNIIT